MPISYRKASEEEYGKVVRFLLDISAQSRFSQTWFTWKYINNPVGPSHIYFAEDTETDSLAGIYCLIGWNLICGNKLVHCAQSVDTMIHPRYRGQGIVEKLSEFMFEDLKKTGVKALCGFPNEKFYPITLKIGWKGLGSMENYVKLLSAKMLPEKFRKYFPRFIRDGFDGLLHLCDRILSFCCGHDYSLQETVTFEGVENATFSYWDANRTNRSPDYLNWRYMQKPESRYRIYCLEKARKKMCWLVSNDRDNESHILDIIPVQQDAIMPALLLFSMAMRKEGKECIRLCCYGQIGKHAAKAGFIFRERTQQIIFYKIDKHGPFNVDRNHWHFMYGDLDAV